MAGALAINDSIKYLNLTTCDIRDIEEMAIALRHNPSLRTLILEHNHIHTRDAVMLVNALVVNTTLESLCMGFIHNVEGVVICQHGLHQRVALALKSQPLYGLYTNFQFCIELFTHMTVYYNSTEKMRQLLRCWRSRGLLRS